MVDAADSKSAGGNFVGVQVPSRAPVSNLSELLSLGLKYISINFKKKLVLF